MKKKGSEKTFLFNQGNHCYLFLAILFFVWLLPVQSLAAEPERITYEGAVFTENEEGAYPEEILEQNGKQYQRVSVDIKPAEKKGELTYVSTTIPLQLEGKQEPPEHATITLECEITGEEYQRDIYLQEIREENVFWEDNFSFPLTIHGYGADVFYLGENEIPADADLAQYGNYFLEYLGLDQDYYRVERVEWADDCYEQDGTVCRDAVAYGEKLIRDVEVLYGGQVRTLDISARQYVGVYEEIIESEAYEESIPVKTEETAIIMETEGVPALIEQGKQNTFIERVVKWIREQITVVVFSSLFVVAVVVWLLLLRLSGMKKKGKAGD